MSTFLQTVFCELFVVWRFGDIMRRLRFFIDVCVAVLNIYIYIYIYIHVTCGYHLRRSRFDPFPPSCGLLVKVSNGSLHSQDECLIFTTKNLVKHVNKLTRQKKTLPFVLLETSCVNNMCHNQCLFYDDVFRLKGGWVGIPPFFRAALPTLNHCVHPPKRWGIQAGAPETNDRKT